VEGKAGKVICGKGGEWPALDGVFRGVYSSDAHNDRLKTQHNEALNKIA